MTDDSQDVCLYVNKYLHIYMCVCMCMCVYIYEIYIYKMRSGTRFLPVLEHKGRKKI